MSGTNLPEATVHAVDQLASDSRARTLSTQILLTGSVVLSFCVIWEFLSWLDPSFWPAIVLSRPTDIIPAFFQAITTGFVLWHFWVTFQETIIGFVLGAGGGFLLGVYVALMPSFRKAFYPMIVLFQSTPRVALAPVFIAWFAYGISAKIALAATICFFPVLVNTITGLTLVDENAGLLMKSLRASRWQMFRHLRLPGAVPTIFAGLKSAITFALIGAIVGELSGTNEGAGHLIETAAFQFRSDDVFAYLLMLSLIGLALFLIASVLEKRLLFWHVEV
ncbi:MAG: ABC transporter permease [bacterium]|nr:ABC transporter permease [bacterium]MDE0643747.1 ABC transporter permease [bacterium]MYH55627.1 ABC transporter permease [Acidimicrobiia bacterium]